MVLENKNDKVSWDRELVQGGGNIHWEDRKTTRETSPGRVQKLSSASEGFRTKLGWREHFQKVYELKSWTHLMLIK